MAAGAFHTIADTGSGNELVQEPRIGIVAIAVVEMLAPLQVARRTSNFHDCHQASTTASSTAASLPLDIASIIGG